MTSVAYIALGANLGDARENIAHAVERISALPQTTLIRQADVRTTEPVGGPPNQPTYVNSVIQVQTNLPPLQLMHALLQIERTMGRDRTTEIRNGPRLIDLDLLLYGDTIMTTPELVLPHPRMQERAFVLDPMCDLAPDLLHPVLKKTMLELLAAIQSETRPYQTRITETRP